MRTDVTHTRALPALCSDGCASTLTESTPAGFDMPVAARCPAVTRARHDGGGLSWKSLQAAVALKQCAARASECCNLRVTADVGFP